MPQEVKLTDETPIDELNLTMRSYHSLSNYGGIKTLGELARKKGTELLRLRNFGPKSLREVRVLLENYTPEPSVAAQALPDIVPPTSSKLYREAIAYTSAMNARGVYHGPDQLLYPALIDLVGAVSQVAIQLAAIRELLDRQRPSPCSLEPKDS